MTNFEKTFLLGVGFTNEKEDKILEFIATGLQKQIGRYYIVTPNPELLVLANKDKHYKNILNNAKLALPDGIGVMLASRLMGNPLKQRITGVDLVEKLCGYVNDWPITVGFLGSGPGVAEKAAECLQKKHPKLKIGLVASEWSDSYKDTKVDILFVAFGSPKQEIWISDNLDKLSVKVAVGVGGAFDFISGKVPRAPKLLRKIGFEWLFRLIIQPWRIKRQIFLFYYLMLVLKEKFTYRS